MRIHVAGNLMLLATLLTPSLLPITVSAVECPPNTRPAVASDAAVQNGTIDVGTCYNPDDVGIGQTAEQAKAYLLSIARNVRDSQAPPDKSHIEPLNDSFAICAASFLETYVRYYGPVYVVSAFRCGPRSPATLNCDSTENARAGGATNSNHQVGIAMDISPAGGNASYDTLRSFAEKNPGYGVTFPWPFYNGSVDKPHMQATNKANPSCSGVPGTPVISETSNPVTDIASIVRKLITGQQQSGGAQQQAQPAYYNTPANIGTPSSQTTSSGGSPAASPTACTPEYFCSGNTYYYKTSSCTNIEVQTCAYGCNGNACALPPASSQINLSGSTSGGTQSGASSTQSTSTLDSILAYIHPTAVDIATATPITLNPDLGNISSVVGQLQNQSSQTLSGNTVALQPLGSQETFTSPDLSRNPAAVNPQAAYTFSVLENMKQALLRALTYLQPFGGIASQRYE